MDTHPPREQFRAVARINQEPVYLPQELGNAANRINVVWGALFGICCFIALASWHVSNRLRDLRDVQTEVTAVKTDVSGLKSTIEGNRIIISTYNWKDWWDQHRTMWDMRQRGESNSEAFYREHGRPAPKQPEK